MGENFLREAIELGLQKMREGHGGPFGCVIVKDSKVIGRGFNQVTSTNDPTAHAEVQAIRDACKNLKSFQLTDCIVYTSCEPCPMCLGAIYWARPKEIYYAATREDAARAGFDDQFLYDELTKKLSERVIPIKQALAKEGAAPFEEWIQNPNKTKY
jgi:tRNA(Arg) A34 adenosine deaminase TadA